MMVEEGDFAGVVEKKDGYYNVIEEMKKETERLNNLYQRSSVIRNKICNVNKNSTEVLGKRIRNLLTNCIYIDGMPINPDEGQLEKR